MKTKTIHVCQSCGYRSPKWAGRCPDCGTWNAFAEEVTSKASEARERSGFTTLTSDAPIALDDIVMSETERYSTGFTELDRALGGGLVPGSLALFGGDPGIGKSTLVLQLLDRLVRAGVSCLYVTGEESREQIKLRAERLGVTSSLLVVAENNLEKILEHSKKVSPQVLVVDSIQTVFLPHLESAPGSVSQVRECAGKLLYMSKSSQTTTLLIGHVTKDGSIAGPRVLEHMVDAVLYFEGEASGQFRILRTIKNRYGSTNEIGVFEMTSKGLGEVTNPSQMFLRQKSQQALGSCLTAAIEGTRPILTEIQSLVAPSALANPRRTAIGIDLSRLNLIIAVLEKHAGIPLFNQDVYVSVTGGLKLVEPAIDAAILLSLVSSYRSKPLSGDVVAFGEVSLTGELRPVHQTDKRLSEARKMGYKTLVISKYSQIEEESSAIVRVGTVWELVDKLIS